MENKSEGTFGRDEMGEQGAGGERGAPGMLMGADSLMLLINAAEQQQAQPEARNPQGTGSSRDLKRKHNNDGRWTEVRGSRTSSDPIFKSSVPNHYSVTALLVRVRVQEEHDLFTTGFHLYGRCWTRIANMIGSRSAIQVCGPRRTIPWRGLRRG